MLYSGSTGGFYNTAVHGDAIPEDAVEVPDDQYHALLAAQSLGKRIIADANGTPIAADPPAPTADQIRAAYEAAAQAMLDVFAQSWGYDSCERMISYIGSANAQWDAEGKAGRQYRDAVWTAAHSIDESVANGGQPPADEDAFLAMLPTPPARPTA